MQDQKQERRRLVTNATQRSIADGVAEYLEFFYEVLVTDTNINLKVGAGFPVVI